MGDVGLFWRTYLLSAGCPSHPTKGTRYLHPCVDPRQNQKNKKCKKRNKKMKQI